MEITKLIELLSLNGVAHFEGYGVKVSFHKEKPIKSNLFQDIKVSEPKEKPSTQEKIDHTMAALAQLPEGEMDFDKILHWSSAPQDETEIKIPLTGEE